MNRELTEKQKRDVAEVRQDLLENLDGAVDLIHKYLNARMGVKGPDHLFLNGPRCAGARAGKLLSIKQTEETKGQTPSEIAINSFVAGMSFGVYLGELGLASFFQEQQKK